MSGNTQCPLLIGKSKQEAIDTCLHCPVPGGCGVYKAFTLAKHHQVTELVAAGMSTAGVARETGVNQRTVQRWLTGK